jgi:hypothetical protein
MLAVLPLPALAWNIPGHMLSGIIAYQVLQQENPQTISQNLTRLRNDATALRNRQEFQRSQLTELANTGFESWANESFEIATTFAYRNGGRIGSSEGWESGLHDGGSGSGASCGIRC